MTAPWARFDAARRGRATFLGVF